MISINNKMARGERGRPVTQALNTEGKPLTVTKTLKSIAPMRMVIVKQVICNDSLSAIMNLDIFVRLYKHNRKAPKAPIAPASEGVKKPMYKPPITRTKRESIPQMPLKETSLSGQEKDSPRGPNFGSRRSEEHTSEL